MPIHFRASFSVEKEEVCAAIEPYDLEQGRYLALLGANKCKKICIRLVLDRSFFVCYPGANGTNWWGISVRSDKRKNLLGRKKNL